MSKQRSANPIQHLPGNDASWFLKAVGVDQTATELRDVLVEGEFTSESVLGLWNATDDLGELPGDWTPTELNRTASTHRNFRWPIVITAILLVAAVVGVAAWLPGTSDRRASSRANEYAVAFASLLPDLPPIQQTLATLTEPDADASQFAELLPIISEADSHAETALEMASQPLPRPWPLAPSEPFTSLSPYRDALSVHATTAKGMTRRLTDLLTYRSVLAEFLVVDMPISSDGVDLNELTADLANATADGSTLLGELPDDAALADHKRGLQELLDRFGDLQVEYIEALRAGRDVDAETLVYEMDALRSDLDQQLVGALARMRSEIDDSLLALNAAIEETLASIPT